MKKLWIIPVLCLGLVAATGARAGCLTGAAAGCAIGHHHAAKEKRANDQNNQNNAH
jgi:hypothetical protein